MLEYTIYHLHVFTVALERACRSVPMMIVKTRCIDDDELMIMMMRTRVRRRRMLDWLISLQRSFSRHFRFQFLHRRDLNWFIDIAENGPLKAPLITKRERSFWFWRARGVDQTALVDLGTIHCVHNAIIFFFDSLSTGKNRERSCIVDTLLPPRATASNDCLAYFPFQSALL